MITGRLERIAERAEVSLDPSLDQGLLRRIRNDLTIRPVKSRFAEDDPEPFEVFEELEAKDGRLRLLVPPVYALTRLGLKKTAGFRDTRDAMLQTIPAERSWFNYDCMTNRRPREYQARALHAMVKRTNDPSKGFSGILCLEPGAGKTVIGLMLVAELRLRTIILVHSGPLLKQWLKRIDKFLPRAKVAVIQGSKRPKPGEEYDVCIGMIQTVMKEKVTPAWMAEQGFGLCLVDECHHIAARKFSEALAKCSTRRVFGLSATPTRSDKTDHLLEYLLGPMAFTLTPEEIEQLNPQLHQKKMLVVKYHPRRTNHMRKRNGDPDESRMLNSLLRREKERNNLIMEILRAVTDAEDGTHAHLLPNDVRQGRLLVLTETIGFLKRVRNEAFKRGILSPDQTGLLIGETKEVDREFCFSPQCRIIFASYAMYREAIDKANIQALVMLTPPVGKMKQIIGRIARWDESEFPPHMRHHPEEQRTAVCIQIVDQLHVFKSNFALFNVPYYVRNNYDVRDWNLNPELQGSPGPAQ